MTSDKILIVSVQCGDIFTKSNIDLLQTRSFIRFKMRKLDYIDPIGHS